MLVSQTTLKGLLPKPKQRPHQCIQFGFENAKKHSKELELRHFEELFVKRLTAELQRTGETVVWDTFLEYKTAEMYTYLSGTKQLVFRDILDSSHD